MRSRVAASFAGHPEAVNVGELEPGLWWWTAQNPDWEPAQSWPSDVRCFCVLTEEATVVVDPLVPEGEEELLWTALDRDVESRGRPVAVVLTQAAHCRDASASREDGLHVWWRHGASDDKWYRERLLPSFRSWLQLPVRHLLVAHGDAVDAHELRAALERAPDYGE
jgi:hypothetical protein